MIGIGILYFLINFLVYRITEEAIYPGLTFNNRTSVKYFISGLLLSSFAFKFGDLITVKCKKLKNSEKSSDKTEKIKP